LKCARQPRGEGVNQFSPNLTKKLIHILDPKPHKCVIKYEHEMKLKEIKFNTRNTKFYVENPMREKP
jgi:hypothetical protein